MQNIKLNQKNRTEDELTMDFLIDYANKLSLNFSSEVPVAAMLLPLDLNNVSFDFGKLNLDYLSIKPQVYKYQVQTVETKFPVTDRQTSRDRFIFFAFNQTVSTKNPCAHAELELIKFACKYLEKSSLIDYKLFVSLEPCLMCAGAMLAANIKHLEFAAYSPKNGAFAGRHKLNNEFIELKGGVAEAKAGRILEDFFQELRKSKNINQQP